MSEDETHPPLWDAWLKIGRMKDGSIRFYTEDVNHKNKRQYDVEAGPEADAFCLDIEKFYATKSVRVK